jgi:hypothetical protein
MTAPAMTDTALLEAVCPLIPTHHLADLLRDRLAPPSGRRGATLAKRDEAIRLAIKEHASMRPTRACEEMAWELTCEVKKPGTGPRAALLASILQACGGEPLGWRQIYNVTAGHRGR